MVKNKKTKPKNPSPNPRHTREPTPSSSSQKIVPSPKSQSKPSGGDEKRKKWKTRRVYVASTVEEETKSYEAVEEVKKSAIAARIVKMQPFREG